MSDNEIRRILAERKRRSRQHREVTQIACEIAAWASLIVICFMLSGLGG